MIKAIYDLSSLTVLTAASWALTPIGGGVSAVRRLLPRLQHTSATREGGAQSESAGKGKRPRPARARNPEKVNPLHL